MIFTAIEQIARSPSEGFITLGALIVAFLVGLTFHEFSHAALASGLGDDTARRQGRVSLNPLVHLDPLGTLLLLIGGFGWAKPTPVNPALMRVSERTGMALTALAGPVSNIIVAFLLALVLRTTQGGTEAVRFFAYSRLFDNPLEYLLGAIVFWNLLLAAFNLLPIAPLDGFKVALGILPRELADSFARLERYGPFILLGLVLLDFVLPGPGILGSIIRPIMNGLGRVVAGGDVL
jgi:Zn-dependent protease